MNKLNGNEMKSIDGGADISATMVNAIYKVYNLIYTLGETLGSYIRRTSENKMCDI